MAATGKEKPDKKRQHEQQGRDRHQVCVPVYVCACTHKVWQGRAAALVGVFASAQHLQQQQQHAPSRQQPACNGL